MKITLSWLKNHLETTSSPIDISKELIQLGHEVEEIEDTQEALKDFKVAKILEVEPHPNADKLQICEIEYGEKETIKVVCAAKNARPGLVTVYACEGTYIPILGKKLRKAKIRGVESAGMLCSPRELGMDNDFLGIIDLGAQLEDKVGEPFSSIAENGEIIFDIGLTPNRADCFSVYGLARDLASTSIGTLEPIISHNIKGAFSAPLKVSIEEQAQGGCPHFSGRYIRGVKNGPSPKWLQDKLKSVGLKSISALVDITNYFCHDRGRPLHVFDADKLQGNLKISLSKKGDTLKALDEETYILDEGMLAIFDEKEVVSLAGIMGGLDSGCSFETTNVFLESAYFSPKSIAKTGQKLKIVSDARTRFERGIDPNSTLPGLDDATQMILDLCGGEVSDLVEAGSNPYSPIESEFYSKDVQALTGEKVSTEKCREILLSLGCQVKELKEDYLQVIPPSWRHDIKIKEDLVEEVIRVIGYDHIPLSPLPSLNSSLKILDKKRSRLEYVKRLLANRGLKEAITYTFISKELENLFVPSGINIENPISEDLKYMRSTLIPGLVEAIRKNLARNITDLKFFEEGACFGKNLENYQEITLGAAYCGLTEREHWSKVSRPMDLQKVKSDIQAVLEAYGLDQDKYQISQDREFIPEYMHPGKTAFICQGPKRLLGYFGKLHPSVLKDLDIKEDILCFEIYLNRLPDPKKRKKDFLKLSAFQAVERDIAVIVDEHIPVEGLRKLLIKVNPELVQWVDVFDVYQGKGVEDGKKSVAFRIRLQSHDKTLRDEDIRVYNEQAVKILEEKVGATLR